MVGFGIGSTEVIDVKTATVGAFPGVGHPRALGPGVTVVRRDAGHRIYMFGGRNANTDLASCEFVDVMEGKLQCKWTIVDACMAVPRVNTCAVLLDHATIVICGGQCLAGDTFLSCELFDLTTHTFSSFPDMLEPRAEHAGVHYMGTIVIIGGITTEKSCEQFDPAIGKWSPLAPLNVNRPRAGADVVENKIYVVGGNNFAIEVYNGSAWSVIGTMAPCFGPCAVVCLGKNIGVIAKSDRIDVYCPVTDTWRKIRLPTICRPCFLCVSF